MPIVQHPTPTIYNPTYALDKLFTLTEFARQARSIIQQFGPRFYALLQQAGCNTPLNIAPESYSNSVKFFVNIELDANGSFADVAPILDELINHPDHFPGDLRWKVESRDSDFSPMRIYTLSNDTFARVNILFQLYVHLPMEGTKNCQVKRITIPPTEAKPTVKYEIVCGGDST